MEEQLGDRVRKTRERYGMTAAELARRVEISRQQLYMAQNERGCHQRQCSNSTHVFRHL